MDKIRKEDQPIAVDIDTSQGVKYNRISIRDVQNTLEWRNPFTRFVYYLIDTPVKFFHQKVEQIRGEERPYYYHKKFNRVPTIDECYTDDLVCIFEATEQMKRDKKVDYHILQILKQRMVECMHHYGFDDALYCEQIREDLNKSEFNFELKWGETGGDNMRAQDVYMKQKHRLILERRKKLKESEAENSNN